MIQLTSHSHKAAQLLQSIKYLIIQDSKRLRTFQVPQELQIPPIPKEIFNDAVLHTLIKLQSAFETLQKQQPKNTEISTVELKGIKGLQVESKLGWFIFQSEESLSTFYYTSPFNGVFKYYYDLESKEWKSNKDRHIMQENVAREIQGKFHAYFDY